MAKELTAATRLMQSSSNELRTLVSVKAKCKQAKADTYCVVISRADVCRLLAEQ